MDRRECLCGVPSSLYSLRFLDDQWIAVIFHEAPSLARTASSAPYELISRSLMRP